MRLDAVIMENNVDRTSASTLNSSYLNTKQAAYYVGLSESLLEKRRCSGDGPTYSQIGKAVRYLTSDLDAWMQANRRRSVAETVEIAVNA
jgi:predicted DNA-binding transcriptional regulator AlpA